MHILTLGIIVGIFTFVKSTPLPTDPDSDSDSDSIQIVPNPDPNSSIDSQNSVQILPPDQDHDMEEVPLDQQPNFLPNGVTGHEIISQTPEEIRVYVAGPPTQPRSALYHPRDYVTRRPYRGPTLRREWAHLVACLKRRPGVDDGIRRNIGK